MKFSPETPDEGYRIRAYAPGSVTVIAANAEAGGSPLLGEMLTRSFVLMPRRIMLDWPPQCFEELAAEHFLSLLELDAEVVLFGSGGGFRFPATAWIAPLLAAGIGVETMDTGAACRTYNVLAAEGRRVAAALLLR